MTGSRSQFWKNYVPGSHSWFEKTIYPAVGYDFEKTIYLAARKIAKTLAAVFKTVSVNETVYRHTFCGK